MTQRFVRIGSMNNVHVYDDADFNGAIETDDVIKSSSPPVADVDVVRLGDLNALILDRIYPIGSIYLSITNTNPATSMGFGTWVRVANGKFLLGEDTTYTPGESTGGSMFHTHSVDPPAVASSGPSATQEVQSGTGATVSNSTHTHSVDVPATTSSNNSNVPPYYVIYVWKRTA